MEKYAIFFIEIVIFSWFKVIIRFCSSICQWKNNNKPRGSQHSIEVPVKLWLGQVCFCFFHHNLKAISVGAILAWTSSVYRQRFLSLHLLCFISNVYKQRFSRLVEFFEKLSNGTSLHSYTKQHIKID